MQRIQYSPYDRWTYRGGNRQWNEYQCYSYEFPILVDLN